MYTLGKVNDIVAAYFSSLGFGVTWDFSRRAELYWHEIYDGDELIAQIDFGAPLVALVRDIPIMVERIPAIGEVVRLEGEPDWQIRASDANLRKLSTAMTNGTK